MLGPIFVKRYQDLFVPLHKMIVATVVFPLSSVEVCVWHFKVFLLLFIYFLSHQLLTYIVQW